MCPIYPFHVILLYLCLLLPLLFAVVEGSEELFANWKVNFIPHKVVQLPADNTTSITLSCDDCSISSKNGQLDFNDFNLAILSNDPFVASVEHEKGESYEDSNIGASGFVIDLKSLANKKDWTLPFNLTGNFLGLATVYPRIQTKTGKAIHYFQPHEELPVSVIRERGLRQKMFSYSVALLISIAYVNMGCALDTTVVRETLRRPIGPAIGFISQFMAMPLISFALGYVFTNPAMRLGLFVTGTSPGGGASNIWTLMFGGNLNLSVTMTAISTFAAFFMMPLWIFSLGKVIFSESDIIIPYTKIFTYAFCLIIPLGVGILITRYLPRVSKFMVRILKPLALFLILFIIIFGIWANLYMFKLMSWQVLLTGMMLPWLGFAFGCTFSRICKRPVEDVIAIAIETGVQNTGVSIFILWFTLDHPVGDLAAVVPVAAATMTPFPLLAALCMVKMRQCFFNDMEKIEEIKDVEDPVKCSESVQKLMDNKIELNGNEKI